MDSAISAARNLDERDRAEIQRVQQGANQLADSSRQLADGVQLLVDQTRVMGSGLDQASAFLLAMKRDAADPAMSGFYIPPEILTQAEFKKAASIFVSEDGHTVRYIVQTALDPFSTAAMDQARQDPGNRRQRATQYGLGGRHHLNGGRHRNQQRYPPLLQQ